jgi:hypothetical protein
MTLYVSAAVNNVSYVQSAESILIHTIEVTETLVTALRVVVNRGSGIFSRQECLFPSSLSQTDYRPVVFSLLFAYPHVISPQQCTPKIITV